MQIEEVKVAVLDNIAPELQTPVLEVLNRTKLNWDVRKEDLISNQKYLETPLAGVFREDSDKFLGAPSKKYTIYQNSELVETIYAAAKHLNLKIVGGGALYEGIKVYLQLELPDEFVGNSQIKRFLTVVNSHNGLGSVSFGSTNSILNKIPSGVESSTFFRLYGQQDKFRHCSIVQQRVRTAVNQLLETITAENKTMLIFKKMAEIKVEDELLRKIMLDCYAIDLNQAAATLTSRQAAKAEKTSAIITQEINKQDGSVWGLFNGILRNTEMSIPQSKNATDYVMNGTGYNVNMKAFNTISQFLNL